MKKIMLLFLFFSCVANAQAQQNTFEKVIDTLGCDNAACIKETLDGGYVFCGGTIFNDAIIVKLDSIGIIEWAKVYGSNGMDAATYVEQTPDSGFIVSAEYDIGQFTQNWVLRLDENGDTLWTRKYSIGNGATNSSQGNNMASINDSIYGQTGYFKTPVSAYFIGSLNTGAWKGHKLYNYAPYQSEGYSIDKTFDDGFIISAYYAPTTSNTDFYLIHTDINGDTVWTRTYDHEKNDAGIAVKQTSDSGYIVAGYTYNPTFGEYNVYLFRTNIIGDTLWTRMYGNSLSSNVSSIDLTSDSGFILAGVIAAPVLGNVYLLKADANGDTLWTRQFGGNNPDGANFVKQTKDKGYIISGLNKSVGSGGAYIIKTDSLGNVASGTGIAELNNPFDFDVFPNPSSGVFTIKTNGIPEKNISLDVFNVSNQFIYQCAIRNNSIEQADLSAMPKGLYLVMLTTSKNRYSKKIIIQ